MTENLEAYAKSLNARDDIFIWLKTTGKKNLENKRIKESDLEHIIDYFNSSAAPRRLLKMSIKDAKRKAREWSDRNKKKGRGLEDSKDDIEMTHSFPDGSFIAKLLTKKAYQREGALMSHCLGGYSPENDCDIYSYRDEKNQPHATFEVRKNSDEIVQIKGKGNGPIHPKYIEPVLQFLESLGMEIRTSEMRNLGYYYIDDEHIDYLKKLPGAWEQVVEVRGKYYAR